MRKLFVVCSRCWGMIKSRAAGFDLVANQIQGAMESKKVLPGRAGDVGVDDIQLFCKTYF